MLERLFESLTPAEPKMSPETGQAPLLVAETADAAKPASVTMPMVQLTPEQQKEYLQMSEAASTTAATPAATPPVPAKPSITIAVYLDDGRVFIYGVPSVSSAREHVSAIIATGYRAVQDDEPNVLTHYPPHRISKVKIISNAAVQTNYTDRVEGT